MIALGLFADGTYGNGFNGVAGNVKGLFYGDGGQFMAQVTSAITILVWCSLACLLFFSILKRAGILRSSEAAEIAGLDMPEMGALAYPDFLEAQGSVFYSTGHNGFAELEPSDARSTREEVGAQ